MEAVMNYKSSYAPRRLVPVSLALSEVSQGVRKINPLLAVWRRQYCFRADLRRLLKVGAYMIEDIGLSHEEALRESAKPFWKT
jgi:uncharacterized protein YjiS (DUF1127 family)